MQEIVERSNRSVEITSWLRERLNLPDINELPDRLTNLWNDYLQTGQRCSVRIDVPLT